MKNRNNFIKMLMILIIVIGLAFIFDLLGIRACPIFNIFHIPCVGCGLTRAIKLLFKGNFIESFKYNILPIPLLIFLIFYFFNMNTFELFFRNHKFICICFLITIVTLVWIINIKNPLLY